VFDYILFISVITKPKYKSHDNTHTNSLIINITMYSDTSANE